MANLSLRIIFGFLYVAIIVTSLFIGTPFFEILMGVCIFFSLREMALLAEKKDKSIHLDYALDTLFFDNLCDSIRC